MENQQGAFSIRFVGTGGAFDVEYGNSSAVVSLGDAKYLIDCGNTVFARLVKLQIASEIEGVFVTHLHDDHVGSLSSFILYHRIVLQKGRLKIFVPTRPFQELLIAFLSFSLGEPRDWVDFRLVADLPGAAFIDTYGLHVAGMCTFSYYFQDANASIVYSGDNGDPDFLFGQLDKLNLNGPTVFHEIYFHSRISAHAHYEDLMRWQDRYKIFGYHCDRGYSPVENCIPLVIDQAGLNY